MAVSDSVRAEVFRRDRAICMISGTPLWILDIGATPFWDSDWVDHVRPASRGGGDTADNLVCASSSANYSRGNNTRDQRYLFRAGIPSYEFFLQSAGVLDRSFVADFKRYSALVDSDWYFNRAIGNLLIWCENRYESRTRGHTYWCASAHKRLKKWKELVSLEKTKSFEQRKLVRYPDSPDVREILSLRDAESLRDVKRVASALSPLYNENCAVWDDYVYAKSATERTQVFAKAKRNRLLSPLLIDRMRRNLGPLRSIEFLAGDDY
jgi:hypothetical protein